MTERPPHPSDEGAADADEPATVWAAIRLDLIPLVLALGALVVNLVSPDSLSPALTPLLLLAIAWVAYRIYRKVQAVHAHR
ncbi:MAG: hypothetical protein ABR500_08615 [Dermatophilaceae bacterium]